MNDKDDLIHSKPCSLGIDPDPFGLFLAVLAGAGSVASLFSVLMHIIETRRAKERQNCREEIGDLMFQLEYELRRLSHQADEVYRQIAPQVEGIDFRFGAHVVFREDAALRVYGHNADSLFQTVQRIHHLVIEIILKAHLFPRNLRGLPERPFRHLGHDCNSLLAEGVSFQGASQMLNVLVEETVLVLNEIRNWLIMT